MIFVIFEVLKDFILGNFFLLKYLGVFGESDSFFDGDNLGYVLGVVYARYSEFAIGLFDCEWNSYVIEFDNNYTFRLNVSESVIVLTVIIIIVLMIDLEILRKRDKLDEIYV